MLPMRAKLLTNEEVRRNSKESELDALIVMRATADFCDRREDRVNQWTDDGGDQYSAYKQGTIDGIQEYRDLYMTTDTNEGDN
jgi:hypothetical protein